MFKLNKMLQSKRFSINVDNLLTFMTKLSHFITHILARTKTALILAIRSKAAKKFMVKGEEENFFKNVSFSLLSLLFFELVFRWKLLVRFLNGPPIYIKIKQAPLVIINVRMSYGEFNFSLFFIGKKKLRLKADLMKEFVSHFMY